LTKSSISQFALTAYQVGNPVMPVKRMRAGMR
jgi:hypothetical protein